MPNRDLEQYIDNSTDVHPWSYNTYILRQNMYIKTSTNYCNIFYLVIHNKL